MAEETKTMFELGEFVRHSGSIGLFRVVGVSHTVPKPHYDLQEITNNSVDTPPSHPLHINIPEKDIRKNQ